MGSFEALKPRWKGKESGNNLLPKFKEKIVLTLCFVLVFLLHSFFTKINNLMQVLFVICVSRMCVSYWYKVSTQKIINWITKWFLFTTEQETGNMKCKVKVLKNCVNDESYKPRILQRKTLPVITYPVIHLMALYIL